LKWLFAVPAALAALVARRTGALETVEPTHMAVGAKRVQPDGLMNELPDVINDHAARLDEILEYLRLQQEQEDDLDRRNRSKVYDWERPVVIPESQG